MENDNFRVALKLQRNGTGFGRPVNSTTDGMYEQKSLWLDKISKCGIGE